MRIFPDISRWTRIDGSPNLTGMGFLAGYLAYSPDGPGVPGRLRRGDARGFLMILKSLVRPKIVGAAGSLFTAARRAPVRPPGSGNT